MPLINQLFDHNNNALCWLDQPVTIKVNPDNCPVPIGEYIQDLEESIAFLNTIESLNLVYGGIDETLDNSSWLNGNRGIEIIFHDGPTGMADGLSDDITEDGYIDSGRIRINHTRPEYQHTNSDFVHSDEPRGRWRLQMTTEHEIKHLFRMPHHIYNMNAITYPARENRTSYGLLSDEICMLAQISQGHSFMDQPEISWNSRPHLRKAPDFDFKVLTVPHIYQNGLKPRNAKLYTKTSFTTTQVPAQHSGELESDVARPFYVLQDFSKYGFDDYQRFIPTHTAKLFNNYTTLRIEDVLRPNGSTYNLVILGQINQSQWVVVYADGWLN